MRLTAYTDFALKVLMYLGMRPARLVTIKEIASAYGISKNHLMKVVHYLGLIELVHTVRGRAGGIRLARKPGDICLGSVVRLTEPDFNMVECFDAARNHCVLSPSCALKCVLARASDAYLARLDRISLADLLTGLAIAPVIAVPDVLLSQSL
jgi:Rrf2 family transcriptional regulator, nitric oxide-sensitive transcriptional repressor